jgi:hypothetical protein
MAFYLKLAALALDIALLLDYTFSGRDQEHALSLNSSTVSIPAQKLSGRDLLTEVYGSSHDREVEAIELPLNHFGSDSRTFKTASRHTQISTKREVQSCFLMLAKACIR